MPSASGSKIFWLDVESKVIAANRQPCSRTWPVDLSSWSKHRRGNDGEAPERSRRSFDEPICKSGFSSHGCVDGEMWKLI